jgi:hypothetical protein
MEDILVAEVVAAAAWSSLFPHRLHLVGTVFLFPGFVLIGSASLLLCHLSSPPNHVSGLLWYERNAARTDNELPFVSLVGMAVVRPLKGATTRRQMIAAVVVAAGTIN